jgi:hypothetical protein
MKGGDEGRTSDTNTSPLPGWLDPLAGYSVDDAQVAAAHIEDLNLAMEAVPRIEQIVIWVTPAPFAMDEAEIEAFIEKSRFRYWLAAQAFHSGSRDQTESSAANGSS